VVPRFALGIVLLVAAIPLGVTAGVMVVAELASNEGLTREGWPVAVVSGVLGVAALISGSWLVSSARRNARTG
jgi:hypothetical protein